MKKLEICCGSYDDVLNAYLAKADRVELNSALHLGGLTPSLGSFLKAKQNTDIEIICMLRPRAAGFNYSAKEIEVIFEDAEIFLKNGADGLAFGFLNDDYSVNEDLTRKMVDLIHSYNKEAVFHRAFDLVVNQKETLEKLIALKVDRVLTSGGRVNVSLGKDNLKMLQELADGRIELLMGSGVNAINIKELMIFTGINQAHSSAKKWLIDKTTSNQYLGYGYHLDNDYDVVDKEIVEKLVKEMRD